MTDPISAAKGTLEVTSALMKAAGDSPEVKQAGKNLGQAAVTLTKTINNALLPLAALNYGIEKARTYFAERFQSEMAEKAASIPSEEIVEPKSSIAGPALQGLAFTHEEPDLKAMYLSLLATAMDKRANRDAHPAFVELIKQIDATEVPLLRLILTTPAKLPIVEIQMVSASAAPNSFSVLRTHYMDLKDDTTGNDKELNEFPAMVDNWFRLGLVEVTYSRWMIQDSLYEWVEQRKQYQLLMEIHASLGNSIKFQRGIISRTAFGAQFARAAGMYDASAPVPAQDECASAGRLPD